VIAAPLETWNIQNLSDVERFMQIHAAEFPKHPVPNIPQPQQPQRAASQQPMVYVYEKQAWEYRIISRNVADESPLSDDELNDLGRGGWELVGVAPLPGKVQFYFKRIRT
jgi:hypothetical protein